MFFSIDCDSSLSLYYEKAFITFGMLLLILHAQPDQFRTGWFLESVISASVIVLVIRTRRPIFKSRPGRYLSMTTLLIIGMTLIFPFTPLGQLRHQSFRIITFDAQIAVVSDHLHVVGGAFMPTIHAIGDLAFSTFWFDGYKIAHLKSPAPIPADQAVYTAADESASLGLEEKASPADIIALRDYDDKQLPNLEAKPYEMTYGQISLLPRVMVDYKP
jgi:hypothetical protein